MTFIRRNARGVLTAGLAVVSVLALAGCAGAAPQAASGDESSTVNTISVSGTGKATGAPDIAYVALGVSITNTDVGQAVSQANAAMTKITQALGSQGIGAADIQTLNYNVYPQNKIDPQTGQPTGETTYHVDSSLQVKVRQMDQIGKVIQAALNSGANSVNGLSFGIEDPSKLQSQARDAAVQDAKQKAGELATSLGVTLGQPITVSETLGSTPQPRALAASGVQGLGGGGEVPVSTGELTVQVQVDVTFRIQP